MEESRRCRTTPLCQPFRSLSLQMNFFSFPTNDYNKDFTLKYWEAVHYFARHHSPLNKSLLPEDRR